MIKTEQFQSHPSVAIADFGTGDIMITKVLFDKGKTGVAVALCNHAVREIGSETTEYAGDGVDHLPAIQILLRFDNPRSLNALIHSLVEAQDNLLSHK